MRIRWAFVVALSVGWAWACRSSSEATDVPDASAGTDAGAPSNADRGDAVAVDAVATDAVATDASDAGAVFDAGLDASDASPAFPALGVYTVDTDGGGLHLLIDAGARELSHVRAGPADWMVATRYGKDPDGNGLAMENEVGLGAYYDGTEVVAFTRSFPYAQTVIAGSSSGGLACNPSWTADFKILYLANAADAGVTSTHLERATMSTFPNVTSVEQVPVPAELKVPVDPHQKGVSVGGLISFSALFNTNGKWMRPLWIMPSSGTSSMAQVVFVGCPICPLQGGCCGWTNIADVLGTNDSRFSHAGDDIMWMQQHPDASVPVGSQTLYPYRQAMRPLDGGVQVDLTPAGTPPTSTYSYGEWRPDDQEIVYWSIDVENGALRQHLHVMSRDGSNRRQIPLPDDLCPLHPSYVSATQIVFNAWRRAPDGSCDVAHL